MTDRPTVSIRFSAAEIAARVDVMATELAAKLPADTLVVSVLKGSFVFAADLVRAMGRAGLTPQVDFLRLASYGAGKESAGIVRIIGDVPEGLAGRRILLVDDIADSGRSLDAAVRLMEEAGAAEVRICALLDKPSRRIVPVPVEFVGFPVDDLFVVGYGIDYAEKYRYLDFVGAVV